MDMQQPNITLNSLEMVVSQKWQYYYASLVCNLHLEVEPKSRFLLKCKIEKSIKKCQGCS